MKIKAKKLIIVSLFIYCLLLSNYIYARSCNYQILAAGLTSPMFGFSYEYVNISKDGFYLGFRAINGVSIDDEYSPFSGRPGMSYRFYLGGLKNSYSAMLKRLVGSSISNVAGNRMTTEHYRRTSGNVENYILLGMWLENNGKFDSVVQSKHYGTYYPYVDGRNFYIVPTWKQIRTYSGYYEMLCSELAPIVSTNFKHYGGKVRVQYIKKPFSMSGGVSCIYRDDVPEKYEASISEKDSFDDFNLIFEAQFGFVF